LGENVLAEQRSTEKTAGFEQWLRRLEAVVESLEEGDLGLEESLAKYEEGINSLRKCCELLEAAERKIQLLAGADADGNPIVRPLEQEADDGDLQAKAQRRSRRRSETESESAETEVANNAEAPTAAESKNVDDPPQLF